MTHTYTFKQAVPPDRRKLKIVGLVASLDFVELITRIKARALWKVGQAFEQVAKEARRPHGAIMSNWI